MNIVILANRDLAANFALQQLAPHLGEHQVMLMLSNGIGKSEDTPPLQELRTFEQQLRLQLYQQQFGQQYTCEQKAYSLAESPQGELDDFEALAQQHQWQLADCSNANTPVGIYALNQHQTHLLISIRYGHILQQPAINSASMGVINLHSGALPQYRGVMASFWALLQGEKYLATSVHTIVNAEIDQGCLIETNYFSVDKAKSYLWHVLNLYIEGSQAVARTIEVINQGGDFNQSPHLQAGQYFSYPSDDDLVRFFEMGLVLFKEEEKQQLIEIFQSEIKFTP